ncbi:MAG: hypothetical protein Q7T49_01280 [bacterium]|nr:hypothetical protein [bacterium]
MDPKKMREIYNKLPEDIREVISSTEHLDRVENIGKKFNLHIDQIGQLGEKTLWVTMGILKPQDFINSLSESLKMPIEQIKPIVVEINNQVFAPIRESLKKVHQLNEDGGGPIVAAKPANFDDRLSKYLSGSGTNSEPPTPPPPYTHDPYHEAIK